MSKKTAHAERRIQQRGLPSFVIDIVEECGDLEHAPGGVDKISLGKKGINELRDQLKRLIQVLDKACGITMIVDGDSLITSYRAR